MLAHRVKNKPSSGVINDSTKLALAATVKTCRVVAALVFYGLSSNSSSLGGNIFVDFISTMLVEIPSSIFDILALDRVVAALVFYGLSSNSSSLGGNIFVDFISTMLVEIPSCIFDILALDRLGRKGTLSLSYLLGGVSCFITGFIPQDNYWVVVGLSLLGKFGITAAFNSLYIYSAEIFPTEYRTMGVGTCSMSARLGAILAPFIASLADTYKPLPLLIFGVLSLVSGCLTVFLPETVGCELPQTIQDCEAFGSDQSIWYFTCCSSCHNKSTPQENTAHNNVLTQES
nr:organic cation transporter protein-like [Cherax quadricarinatus]